MLTPRPLRLTLVALLGLAAAGCEGVAAGVAVLLPGLVVLLVGVALVQGARRLLDPGRYDPSTRLLADTARRLGLPAPRRATRLAWPLTSGLEAEAEADGHLELRVAMPDQIPASVSIDRPALPRGIGMRQVPLPRGMLEGFLVHGDPVDVIALLGPEVRAALQETASPPIHVAIEQGALRVRLRRSCWDLADDAAERLDRVGVEIARLPASAPERLADRVAHDPSTPLRTAALRALLDRYPEHPKTAEAMTAAEEAEFAEGLVRRWTGRHGAGALSLPIDDPRGQVAFPDAPGALSKSEDD